MKQIRMGVIGLGNIGLHHADYLQKNKVEDAVLAAVSDVRGEHARRWAEERGGAIRTFDTAEGLIDSGACDAVIVATPPGDHPPLAIRAFAHDLHVLVEKPAGACCSQVREMNRAASASGKVFGIMFMRRVFPVFQKAKNLIMSGELGELQRTQWTTTQWFRVQDYYDSGGWRGTWQGEGGGVLNNQCPHDLDVWQWLCGMPATLRGFCRFGQWHDIEVEDDVTAYVEYPNGATGVFVASTGEFPGINRLEIVGDRGTLTITEDKALGFKRSRLPVRQFSREFKGGFGCPECWNVEIPLPARQGENRDITQNFVNAILKGEPLVAPGEEGVRSLELADAMRLSTWLGAPVTLPIDDARYGEILQEKIRAAKPKKVVETRTFDVTQSWR